MPLDTSYTFLLIAINNFPPSNSPLVPSNFSSPVGVHRRQTTGKGCALGRQLYALGVSGSVSGDGMGWVEGKREATRLKARKTRNRLRGLSRWEERARSAAGVGRSVRALSIRPILRDRSGLVG